MASKNLPPLFEILNTPLNLFICFDLIRALRLNPGSIQLDTCSMPLNSCGLRLNPEDLLRFHFHVLHYFKTPLHSRYSLNYKNGIPTGLQQYYQICVHCTNRPMYYYIRIFRSKLKSANVGGHRYYTPPHCMCLRSALEAPQSRHQK